MTLRPEVLFLGLGFGLFLGIVIVLSVGVWLSWRERKQWRELCGRMDGRTKMVEAWLVVREEKHTDDKYWVCRSRADAIKIAEDVTAFWLKEYNPNQEDINTERHTTEYQCIVENAFRVFVQVVQIREVGETAP